jgi:hypothetical protein
MHDGRYARIVCSKCRELNGAHKEAMNGKFDPLENPGDLLHAMLESLIVVEISDVTTATKQFEPPDESRRSQGIQSIRKSHVSNSRRSRPTR